MCYLHIIILSLIIELPVPSQESERSCIHGLGSIDFASVSTMFWLDFWNCSNSVGFALFFNWFFTNKWDLWSDRFRINMLLCCDQSIKGVIQLLTVSTIISDQSIMQIIALFFSLKFFDSYTGLNDFELLKYTNQTPYSTQTHTFFSFLFILWLFSALSVIC